MKKRAKHCYTKEVERRFGKKNVVAIAVLCAVFLAGAIYITKVRPNTKKDSEHLAVNSYETQKNLDESASQDSDNDGLRDWEEVLLKTDPKNPDTDGDGTLDGDEVSAGRNPLKAGPDDDLSAKNVTVDTQQSDAYKGVTATDELAVELFSEYIKLKENNQLNTKNSSELINTLVGKASEVTRTETYTTNDIAILNSPKEEDLMQYSAELTDIFKPNPEMGNDIIVLKQILEAGDRDSLVKLDTSIVRYQEVISRLLAMPVPQAVSTEHIVVINAFKQITESVKGMRSVFTDPLRALVGIKEYGINEQIFIQNLQTIGAYLRTQGITI